jgi:DNA-binding transcriptional ArsR family regulator
VVGLDRRAIVGVAVFAFLLLAPAAGALQEAEDPEASVSTTMVTCEAEKTCSAPSAEARVGVDGPDLDPNGPDPACATQGTQGEDAIPSCNVSQPDLEPATVSTYAAVDGLDRRADDGGDEAETHGQRAADGSGSGLGLDTEAGLLLGALGLGASGAAALVGLRRFATLLLAPLASRLTRSEILENDTRKQIYEAIEEEPGINLRGLADEVDVAWGTLLHHLKKLEKAHLVKSERYGKYRRFFKNGSTYSEEEQERLAALSTPSTARVAEYILENPGANQSEIGDEIGVTASTILFHVKRLKEVDLVEEEREGRYVHYYPNLTGEEAERVAAQ